MSDSDIPVLYDFWAPWCGPCRVMSPIVDQIKDKYQGQVKVQKINVDEYPGEADRFGIRTIPTFILEKQGVEIMRCSGVYSQEQLEEKLNGR